MRKLCFAKYIIPKMIFELYYSDIDDYRFFLFEADKTKEQWEAYCKQALKDVAESYFQKAKKSGHWAMLNYWVDEIPARLEQMGYQSIKATRFGFSGGYIFEEGDKKDAIDHNGTPIVKLVGEEILNRMIAYNDQKRKEHDERVDRIIKEMNEKKKEP